MSSTPSSRRARPGQIRFEAWVPAPLMAEFSKQVPNRKQWLVNQMVSQVQGSGQHHHRRVRQGDRWVNGSNLGRYWCPDCGADLTLTQPEP